MVLIVQLYVIARIIKLLFKMVLFILCTQCIKKNHEKKTIILSQYLNPEIKKTYFAFLS